MKKMLIELLTGAFLLSSTFGVSGCAYPPVVEVEYHYQHSHPHKRHHRYYPSHEVVIYAPNCVSCHKVYHVHPPNPHHPYHPVIIQPNPQHQHQQPLQPKKQITVTKQKTSTKKTEKTPVKKVEKSKTKEVKTVKTKP